MSRFLVHHRFPFLRRLYDQRDQARSERDRAIADRDCRVAERDAAITERDHCRTQRDAVIAERDCRVAERDEAVVERDRLRARSSEVANLELPATPFGKTSEPPVVDDSQLVVRLIAAIKRPQRSPPRRPNHSGITGSLNKGATYAKLWLKAIMRPFNACCVILARQISSTGSKTSRVACRPGGRR